MSTEFYYYLEYGMEPLMNQYYWLKQDLEQVCRLLSNPPPNPLERKLYHTYACIFNFIVPSFVITNLYPW